MQGAIKSDAKSTVQIWKEAFSVKQETQLRKAEERKAYEEIYHMYHFLNVMATYLKATTNERLNI